MKSTHVNYTSESLMDAIFQLLPAYKDASGMGASFNAPSLLKVVTEKFFMDHFSGVDLSDADKDAYLVCHSAMKDLESGSFKFSKNTDE